MNEGVKLVLPNSFKNNVGTTAFGSKLYTAKGEEISGVVSWEIPEMTADRVMVIKITAILSDISYE